MRVAGYVRVSTEKQKKDGSHERQRERLEEWAGRQDEEISLQLFEDIAVSGQSDNRGSYHELMDSVDDFDAVVVRELSRFGRNPLEIMNDVEYIVDKTDTDFVSITESFDTSTAMGKAMFRMVAVVNGLKSDLSRERAVETYNRKMENGENWGRYKKLPAEKRAEVFNEYREKNLGYSTLAKIYRHDTGDGKLDRSTVRRWIKEIEAGEDDEIVVSDGRAVVS